MLGRRICHVKASSQEQCTRKQPDPKAQGHGWMGKTGLLGALRQREESPHR